MHYKSLCFTVLTFVCATTVVSAKQIWAKSYLNQKAPQLVVEKWLAEQPSTKGKFVLIDFWATWCPPCREAIPELNEIHRKFREQLVVIGISDESESKVRAMKDPEMDYFVAIDTRARMKKKLEITGIPHVVLIDPNGVVRWEGYPLLEGDRLSAAVVGEIIARYSAKP